MFGMPLKADIDRVRLMSGLPPKADIGPSCRDVRFVPKDGVIGRRLVDS